MIFQTKNETETRSFEVIDMVNDLLPLKSLKTEEECEEVSNREKFVLVIVTGGTLCMKKNEKGNYIPAKGFLNNAIGNISLLHDKDYYNEFIAPRKMLHQNGDHVFSAPRGAPKYMILIKMALRKMGCFKNYRTSDVEKFEIKVGLFENLI